MRTLLSECVLVAEDNHDTYEYLYEEDGVIHHAETPGPTPLNELPAGPINKYLFMPKFKPAWKRYIGLAQDVWIKKPFYGPERAAPDTLRTTTRELEIVNDLPPHPNLCVYHGCVLDGEYIRGMVYEKLHSTLDQQVSGQKRVDGKWIDLKPEERVRVVPEEVLRDVRAALQHIRTQLGLLYIDIHHNNIMWRSRPGTKRGGEWCIIDFSECYPDGHTFEHEFGNPGWISCKARVVDDALNETSLAHLDTYMRTGEAPYPDWEWAHWNQERSDEN